MAKPPTDNFSRRSFLKGSGAAAAATALTANVAATADGQDASTTVISEKATVTLNVNGEDHEITLEPRTTLLEALRYHLDLTGAKPVSLDGSSGASTVLIDGKPAMASTTLAISTRGRKIETVESMADDVVPKAFVDHDATQCGFCTPGFVVAVRAFLNSNPQATEEQIRAGLNGNICRCGTYANIVQAAVQVVKGGRNG
ncbi:MAG: (2Fe-2S)-binding protein [Planctomycetaceae bacterium]|nr:(2Fe-2S)-binding protein [Planctomycetaceae bacterium]